MGLPGWSRGLNNCFTGRCHLAATPFYNGLLPLVLPFWVSKKEGLAGEAHDKRGHRKVVPPPAAKRNENTQKNIAIPSRIVYDIG